MSCGSDDTDTAAVSLTLEDGLKAFRDRLSAEVQKVSGKEAEPLAESACTLIESILLGVQRHLPTLSMRCELGSGSDEEVVSLDVHIDQAPVIGEVATPSRFCHEVLLLNRVRFALRRPSCLRESPLVLSVSGLELPPLSEIPALRERIKTALGPKCTPETALKWWLQNKDELYPLATSKFHRIYESMWGTCSAKFLPKAFPADFLWGFLNGTHCRLEAFEFRPGKSAADVKLTARRLPGATDEERELGAISSDLALTQLRVNRTAGERLAASVTNFAALVYGEAAGQRGASAKSITKLFTAASWGGGGDSSWMRHDPTWRCRDETNAFGRVTKEQGRIFWKLASPAATTITAAASSSRTAVSNKTADAGSAASPDAPVAATSAASQAVVDGDSSEPLRMPAPRRLGCCCKRRPRSGELARAWLSFGV